MGPSRERERLRPPRRSHRATGQTRLRPDTPARQRGALRGFHREKPASKSGESGRRSDGRENRTALRKNQESAEKRQGLDGEGHESIRVSH